MRSARLLEISLKARSVSRDLWPTSEKYSALEVADDPLWQQYSIEARRSVSNLKLLGGRQVHPVLLSALDKFTEREVERLLSLLEVLVVRYQLVGGGRTGRLEISCARLAQQIYDGQCDTATEAFNLIKDIFPNDQKFREDFRTTQESNNQKARYLLSGLEQQARSSRMGPVSAHELEPGGSLKLEHIFPRSPGTNWKSLLSADPEFADEYTYRMGNLCLLTNVNRTLGNRGFEDKKRVLQSPICCSPRRSPGIPGGTEML